MALKQTVRLVLFDKTPYAIQNDRTQEKFSGFIYEGFDVKNRVHRFTSQKDSYPVFDGAEYEEKNARDFELYGRTDMGGRTKWRDYEVPKKDLTAPREIGEDNF